MRRTWNSLYQERKRGVGQLRFQRVESLVGRTENCPDLHSTSRGRVQTVIGETKKEGQVIFIS